MKVEASIAEGYSFAAEQADNEDWDILMSMSGYELHIQPVDMVYSAGSLTGSGILIVQPHILHFGPANTDLADSTAAADLAQGEEVAVGEARVGGICSP